MQTDIMRLIKKLIPIALFISIVCSSATLMYHNTSAYAVAIKKIQHTNQEYLIPSREKLFVKSSSSVFLNPTDRAKKVASVSPGQELTAMGKMSDGKWYLVRRNGKTLGYIHASVLIQKDNRKSVASRSRSSLPASSPPPSSTMPSPEAKGQQKRAQQKDTAGQGPNNTQKMVSLPVQPRKNPCELVATVFITMERTKEQLAAAEQKWGQECPDQVRRFRKIVEARYSDPLALANIQNASFQELFTAVQKTPAHNNAMLAKLLLPQKAERFSDISQLVAVYPDLKATGESPAASLVQTIKDAQSFLSMYPESNKRLEVLQRVFEKSKAAGPGQFLHAAETFPDFPISADLQNWYLQTVTNREQLKNLADRFPAAKKEYVVRSETLQELLAAAKLYPEFSSYVAEKAIDYVKTKEDAKLFFAKYPDHSASVAIFENLAAKALEEGRSSFKEFVRFFPDRPVPPPLIEKYIDQAKNISELFEDVQSFIKMYPDKNTKAEVLQRVFEKSKSAGPEQFLHAAETFPNFPISADLQNWYLQTVTNREQHPAEQFTEKNIELHKVTSCQIKDINDDTNSYITVIWDGECIDGKAAGFGRAKRTKQSPHYFYEGYMENGLAYGIGKSRDKDGSLLYIGYYRNGYWDGPGIAEADGGRRIAAYRKKGLPAGQMILALQQGGQWYYGEFYCDPKNGECTGFGSASQDNAFLFQKYVPDGKISPQVVIRKYRSIMSNKNNNIAIMRKAEEDAVEGFWDKRELFKIFIVENNFTNSTGKVNDKNVDDIDVGVLFVNTATKTIRSTMMVKMAVRDNSPISLKYGNYKVDVTFRLYLNYKTSTILGTTDYKLYKHKTKVTFNLNRDNNWTDNREISLGNIDLGTSGRVGFVKLAEAQLKMMKMDYTIH